ncbi:hypothetical protein [Mycolicibacter icosiumassiliensis]|uniref:hypothetical protein n=1 Tax=Mycolicibacter icosiumassiliensis TaxID=1792835 RepID=UPI00082A7CED|nr:hypothetical protein [Mycolicibacter icosiumassiliensis]
MKHVALGIVTGGAAAAAYFGSAIAYADDPTGSTTGTGTESWSPIYGTDSATLVQVPGSQSLAWDLPASFTNGSTTLTGTDYLAPSSGGFNNEFVTSTGATYDQDQLFPGVTNLYYDSGVSGAAPVDVLKTSFGDFNASSLASLFTPTTPAHFIDSGTALQDAGLYSALDLGPDGKSGSEPTWTPTYGDVSEVTPKAGGAPVWEVQNTTFTPSTGTALTGTDYLAPSLGGYNNDFVTSTGATYDQDQLLPGVTNLYYDATADGTPVDILKTSFGDFNISSMASWFTPVDYSDAVVATPDMDLTDAGLYSALDLGLPTT